VSNISPNFPILNTTAKQDAMAWACAAKMRQRVGEEMYGV